MSMSIVTGFTLVCFFCINRIFFHTLGYIFNLTYVGENEFAPTTIITILSLLGEDDVFYLYKSLYPSEIVT